ncbi:MAG: ParB/RepB/Spo0J family partition protein [Bacteroidaceae bacterium]|nr:ParB/RepB/Spo0J family partition protein [Bacteroidaceae bacterium]
MNKTRAEHLPIEKLCPFEGHPFKVADNEEMDQLVESIMAHGVLTPLVVRPLENGEYEVISGHRRLHACKRAGIESVPAVITEMDRDAAAIALVDSNLHREHILPSEKAFAYKLKMDALKHQGQTCGQVGHKSRDTLSDSESGRQVQRYIRLTHLIPEILQMVDDGKIALTPAVEISYLTKLEQADLLETMECEDCTPSLSQAMQMKQLSQAGELDMDTIFGILTQLKPNQQEKISFKVSELRSYFPRSYTASQMTRDILKGLELLRQHREQNRDGR